MLIETFGPGVVAIVAHSERVVADSGVSAAVVAERKDVVGSEDLCLADSGSAQAAEPAAIFAVLDFATAVAPGIAVCCFVLVFLALDLIPSS